MNEYYDILDTVVSNGRLELNTPEELEIEIEHEARERGLSDDEIAEAVEYALDHYQFYDDDDDATDELAEFCDMLKHRIHVEQLLCMPDREAIEKLRQVNPDAAEQFADYNGDPDGDLWLNSVHWFNYDQRQAALSVGGFTKYGYSFEYPQSVHDEPGLPSGWCAYNAGQVGYALEYSVAFDVCAASYAKEYNRPDLCPWLCLE